MFIIVLYLMYLYNLPDLRCTEHPIISSLFPLMHVGVPLVGYVFAILIDSDETRLNNWRELLG